MAPPIEREERGLYAKRRRADRLVAVDLETRLGGLARVDEHLVRAGGDRLELREPRLLLEGVDRREVWLGLSDAASMARRTTSTVSVSYGISYADSPTAWRARSRSR